jgi:VWFA-related protein
VKGRGLRVEGIAVAALAVALLLSSLVVESQTQPPQPTFRTEANYVRVDVYPTRDGQPVTDLMQADFELFEGGALQQVEQFEHVTIRAAGPQDTRVEPSSVHESLAMAQGGRARLIVLFLDIYHVDAGGSHNIRKPLVDALDRLIGADDLVAVMTPEMSAKDITFARKTTTIEGLLTRNWNWGVRDGLIQDGDPEDQAYGACYPNVTDCPDQRGIAAEMIDRRHEKVALSALEDLVRYLRGVREERKAILAISDGWLLFRPNQALARPLACHGTPTGLPPVSVDPRSGRLTTKDAPSAVPISKCEADRMQLSQLDNDREFRDLLDAANRANASFYPIDPRGLAAFDTPLIRQDVPGLPPATASLRADQTMLSARLTSLRTLAEATDGLAIVNSNDLDCGLKRVVDDLSSYYLLGYYSSAKLDGRFHPISVRVKRPGVQVRARRGYLSLTPAEAARMSRAAMDMPMSVAEATAVGEAHAVEAAISPLGGYARDVPMRLQVAAGWKGDTSSATVWVTGELGPAAVVGDSWSDGFDATATLTTTGDVTVATGRIAVPRGARTFRIALASSAPIAAGEYQLRVGARAGPASIPSRDVARLEIPAAPSSVGALYVRRGPSTGNREVPTADLRYRRSEQVRVEVPYAASDPLTARLLDRTGKPLAVPVAASVRDDPDGSRWATGQLALAPLAPGDYVIEMSSGTQRMLSSFRIIP